jgi:predicted DNA-binding WGR domain protein
MPAKRKKRCRSDVEPTTRKTRAKVDDGVEADAASNLVHENIACDGCQQSPLQGIRFRCLECEYDLCAQCEAGNGSPRPAHEHKLERCTEVVEDEADGTKHVEEAPIRQQFDLLLPKDKGSLRYKMWITQDTIHNIFVNYSYGRVGASGRTGKKIFSSLFDPVAVMAAACAFVEAKFQELTAKGYQDRSSVNVPVTLPISKPGQSLYMEKKDYWDSSSGTYFYIELNKDGETVFWGDGNIPDPGNNYSWSAPFNLSDDETTDDPRLFIAHLVQKRSGYKKKKNMPAWLLDAQQARPAWMSDESGLSDADSSN